jgi:large subunit ribosomal protein L18
VCPRLNVFRSSNHIYAQIINDDKQSTLAFASSLDEVFKKLKSSNKEIAKKVGKLVGERATAKNISCVVFDRAGYLYHGRVKELADGAREAGLKF